MTADQTHPKKFNICGEGKWHMEHIWVQSQSRREYLQLYDVLLVFGTNECWPKCAKQWLWTLYKTGFEIILSNVVSVTLEHFSVSKVTVP